MLDRLGLRFSDSPFKSFPPDSNDVVAWSEVDAIWLAQVRYAEKIKNQVVETYLHKPGVESIDRGLGPKTIGGFSMETIHVLVSDEASADALELPEQIGGIPIVVEIGHIYDTE